MKYLLRFDGVNFDTNIGDTKQLSVQRGGSLLLRKAALDIQSAISSLKAISQGGSVGLFEFEANSQEDAEKTRDDVVHHLREDKHYGWFTFVVDFTAINDNDFSKAHETVIALNRFRQYSQPTLALPEVNQDPDIEPCAWDNLRPAAGHDQLDAVSRFSKIRYEFGRSQKKRFVNNQTRVDDEQQNPGLAGLNFDYTNDLHEIADAASSGIKAGNLQGKIAVIYFDGNGFGKVNKGKTASDYTRFDCTILNKRRQWLRSLLEEYGDDPNFVAQVGKGESMRKVVRLELLLWGGDEIMVVVPAWCGMEVLQHFYRFHENWEYDDTLLTHAAGLVFCNARTPIAQIKQLAVELADNVKDRYLGKDNGKIDKYTKAANLYDYVALESIDYPTQSWPEFLAKRYTSRLAMTRLPSTPLYGRYSDEAQAFRTLLETLPSRQLNKLCLAVTKSTEAYNLAYTQFKKVVDGAAVFEAQAKSLFGSQSVHPWYWLHLIELWDYFVSPENDPDNSNNIGHGSVQGDMSL